MWGCEQKVLSSLSGTGRSRKDQAKGKNNTLTLLGIDQSRKELTDLIKQAQDDLHGLKGEVLAGFLDLYQKVL